LMSLKLRYKKSIKYIIFIDKQAIEFPYYVSQVFLRRNRV